MSFIKDFTTSAFGSVEWASPDKNLTPRGSGDGEGGLPRGGISSGKEVGLILVNLDVDFSGKNPKCGGQIGSGSGKMCIREGCDVAAHKKKHKLLQQSGVMVCIEVKHQGDAVFGTPVIPLKDFNSFENFKDQLREVEGWESLFGVLQRKAKGLAASLSAKEVENLEFKAAARTAATPFKASSRKLEAELDLEDGFEMISDFHGTDVMMNVSDDFAFKAMQTEWESMVNTLGALKEWAGKSKKHSQEFYKEFHEKVTTFELEFLNVQTVLGERPDDLPRDSVFDLIQQSFQAQGLVKPDPDSASISADDLRAAMNPIQATLAAIQKVSLSTKIAPLVEDFGQQYLDGNKLSAVFQAITKDRFTSAQMISDLQSEVAALKAEMAQMRQQQANLNVSNTGINAFTSSAFNLPSVQASNASSATITNPGGSSNVDSRLKAMETAVSDLQAQSVTSAVTVGKKTFVSEQDTQAWLTLNVKIADAYLLFVDLHSFLAIIKGVDSSSPQNFAKSKADARKAGFSSETEAAVASSFERDLPVLFGVENTGSSSKFDTREMPLLPTFDEFGSISDPTGFSTRFLEYIDQTRDNLRLQAEHKLTGEAKQIAEYMIGRVAETAHSLIHWMGEYYLDFKSKNTPPKEAWRLVTQSTRSLFAELHQERQAGRSVTNYSTLPGAVDDHRGHVVWGCLQGFKRLEIIRKRRVVHDRSVNQALFQFLLDNAVLKPQLEEYKQSQKKEVDKLKTELAKKANK